jgi:hypothetical protein
LLLLCCSKAAVIASWRSWAPFYCLSAAGVVVLQAISWVSGTRKVYYDELVRDVRLLTLLRAAFFSPGKQAALCALSSYVATLLANISRLAPSTVLTAGAAAAAAAAGPAEGPTPAVEDSSSAVTNIQPAVQDAAAVGQSKLLCYVPVVYIDVIVDFLTALRRCQEPSGTGQWVLQVRRQPPHAAVIRPCCHCHGRQLPRRFQYPSAGPLLPDVFDA